MLKFKFKENIKLKKYSDFPSERYATFPKKLWGIERYIFFVKFRSQFFFFKIYKKSSLNIYNNEKKTRLRFFFQNVQKVQTENIWNHEKDDLHFPKIWVNNNLSQFFQL